jgi:hypothetical protein
MLELSSASIVQLAVHKVGNKLRDEPNIAADHTYPLDDELRGILSDYFLKPFKGTNFLRFHHSASLEMNEVYSFCKRIFESEGEEILEQSQHILTHLYESSNHQNIKSGEVYIVYFSDCVVGDEVTDAVGIFKSENRSTFLQFDEQPSFVKINAQQGIDIKKLDKGCLVFNTDQDLGYLVKTVDNNTIDALFWTDAFLHVQTARTEMYFTESAMNMCRSFANEVVAVNDDKKEEVLFLDRSVEYFAENTTFDLEGFAQQVLQEPEKIAAFKTYQQQQNEEHHVATPAKFEISESTVRDMEKKIRNSIKLDTNIEIRFRHQSDIPIDRYLERGYDDKKEMHYYRVYFNKEW